jgi:tetratricopeptide (TPR) repeat protein
VNLGWLLQDVRKDLNAAEVCYRDAIELDPNNVQATYNLGLLLDSRGGDGGGGKKAEERYRRAIELDPNNVLALIRCGFKSHSMISISYLFELSRLY